MSSLSGTCSRSQYVWISFITASGVLAVASVPAAITSSLFVKSLPSETLLGATVHPTPLQNVTLSTGPWLGLVLAQRLKKCDTLKTIVNASLAVFFISTAICVVSFAVIFWRILVIRRNRSNYVTLPESAPQSWQENS